MKSNGIRAAAAASGSAPERIAEKIAWLETCDGQLGPEGIAVLFEVFPTIMREHYDPVWRRIRRWGVPEADVEDVLQDVFTRLFRRVRGLGAKSGLGPILGKITKGKVIDYVRAQQRAPETVVYSSGSGMPESEPNVGAAVDFRELAQRFFPSLPPVLRTVVEKVILGDMTDPEAAEALGLPEGTVKSRRRRAIQVLQALWALWQPPSRPATEPATEPASEPPSEPPSGEIAA